MLRSLAYAFAFCALLQAASLAAEDAPAKPKSIPDLVKQLDAESFGERQGASEELQKRGKEALPAIVDGAKSESAETASRSLDILRKHLEGSDAELKSAAKEALQKIASGDSALARSAAAILNPKPMTTPAGQPMPPIGGIGGGGIRIIGGGAGGGAFRIAVAAAGGAGKRVSVKDVDGVKEIEAVEGDRTVKINDDPAKGIKIKVTDKKDGKEETKEYEAKNADELKEKHPEGHKIYEQYKGGIAEIRLEALPIEGFAPAFPAPVPAIGRVRPAVIRDTKDVIERLDKAKKQLDDAAAKLKKIGAGNSSDEIKQAIEAIEQSQKELEEVRAKFPM